MHTILATITVMSINILTKANYVKTERDTGYSKS